LKPDALLLVAPDRLGVLHDVASTTRAASTTPLRVDGIILMAPEQPDASTGRNASELSGVTNVPVLAVLPRAAPDELGALPAMRRILKMLTSPKKAATSRI
jgi:dethiobiotin synthetase